MKQGEYWHNEQGAGIEVDVPGCRVVVFSRVRGDPCMQVVQSNVKQKPQPVDQGAGTDRYRYRSMSRNKLAKLGNLQI